MSVSDRPSKQSCFRARTQNRITTLILVNLPGWCWAEIQQFALVGSSSSLHSEACNALGASDGVIHSRISQEVDCFRASTNIRIDTQSIVLLLCCVRLPCVCCPSMAPHTCGKLSMLPRAAQHGTWAHISRHLLLAHVHLTFRMWKLEISETSEHM